MKQGGRIVVLLGMLLLTAVGKADGGGGLDGIIRLPAAKNTVYALLGKVSEQSGYLFIYDSSLVNSDAVVRVKKKTCSVRQAIYEITGRSDLQLKLLGQHILIAPPAQGAGTRAVGEEVISPPLHTVVAGRLLDKETGGAIANASVLVRGTSIGNVTNGNGEFRLLLPDSLKHAVLAFSHLGYVAQSIGADALAGSNHTLSLEPKVIPLQEVLVRLIDPRKLLREMMEFRSRNYASQPVYLTTFYREGVQLKNKFQSLTEAVFSVYKSPALPEGQPDQVKLLKMSRINNRETTDSLIAKIRSGVDACLQLDIVKNIPDFLLPETEGELYAYTSGDIVPVGDRSAHVISFEQKQEVKEPLYCGELYIDTENSALLQARFEIQPRYVKNATRFFVVRQTSNIRLTTQKIVYTITYKPWKGTYYMHHIRGDLYFKAKKRRYWFSSPSLYTWFEMVTCRIDEENVVRFPRSERMPTHTILADTDFKYDESFWQDFNIIPLEKELGKIIEKVALKIEKTDLP